MKRSKLVLFSLVIALIAMGAGYAAWVQDFEVEASVDTGQMDIHTSLWPNDFIETYAAPEYDDALYPLYDAPYMEAVDGHGTDDDLTFTVTNIYPGAYIYFEAITHNDGTLPMELDDIRITGENQELLDHLNLEYRYYVYEGSRPFKYIGTFNTIEELVQASKDEEVLPGYWCNIGVFGQFDENVGADEFEETSGSFTMDVTFGQFNQ